MLFSVSWQNIDSSEAGEKRSLALFAKWQPAAGAEFKGFYGFADGTGGIAIIEVDSAATLTRVTTPWLPWLKFSARAIVPIEELASISAEAIAFRESAT